jgi:hypothetical protein
VDLADQYLSCCSTLRKTCQWEQEGRAWLDKLWVI